MSTAPVQYRAAARTLSALLLAAAAAACEADTTGTGSGAPAPVEPAPVASVKLSPDTATIVEGWMRQMELDLRVAGGGRVTGRTVEWTSSDTLVAVVSATGEVRARRPGIAVVTARVEGREGRATIRVEARRATAITLSRTMVGVGFMQSAHIGASVTAQDGQGIDAKPTWTSSNPELVSVDSTGKVTGRGAGSASIKARVGDVVAEAYVTSAGPVLSGSWTLAIPALEGDGTLCSVYGVHLGLTLQGVQVQGGSQAWSSPSVGCDVTGGEPPFSTPFPPSGPLSGVLHGTTLSVHFGQAAWTLNGTFTAADRIEGDATYYETVDDELVVRTGRFVLRKG